MTDTKELQQTFFDSLLLTDSERIHSQMMAWILNLPATVFTTASKTTFLNQLFTTENTICIEKQCKAHSEINHIDILLETDNYIIVIENKLKSSEHSLQSFRYNDSIPDSIEKSDREIKCVFLSLIGEKPKNKTWSVITYNRLLESLTSIEWNNNVKETVFIKEYIQTLNNLVITFTEFINNHNHFDTVFTDGIKSKHNKYRHDDAFKDYIRVNQLETIFQKAFLKAVAVATNLENYVIGETRGNALIQLFIEAINYEGREYHLGLQLQGQCLKINLILQTEDHPKEVLSNIPLRLADHFGQIYSKQNNYKRFNKNNKNPYISVSKTHPIALHQMNTLDLGKMLTDEIEVAKLNIDRFKNQLITIE